MSFYRQGGKDPTKKGPNVKLGPQGEKKGLGQDSRKDSSLDSGHHSKVRTCSAAIIFDGLGVLNESGCLPASWRS